MLSGLGIEEEPRALNLDLMMNYISEHNLKTLGILAALFALRSHGVEVLGHF